MVKPEREHSYALSADGKQELPNGEVLDWNRGMIWQCGLLVGDCYDEWIHRPQTRPLRFFDSPLLESLTFVPAWTVPAVFVPWSLLELWQAFSEAQYSHTHGSVLVCGLYYVTGLMIWGLLEYAYHRHAFHWDPESSLQRQLHFLLHGQHHLVPADQRRLVMPPSVNVPIALLHRCLVFALFPRFGEAPAMFAGGLLGYCLYEVTHFLIHHPLWRSHWMDRRSHYHDLHHFHPDKRESLFGVSHQLWDSVFGTL